MEYETWKLTELTKAWSATHDEMVTNSLAIEEQISQLQCELAEIQAPYHEVLVSLEGQIRPQVLDLGRTVKDNGVELRFRKGARRISYDWRQVDAVQAVLEDIAPGTARILTNARRESVGKPSVSIVRA